MNIFKKLKHKIGDIVNPGIPKVYTDFEERFHCIYNQYNSDQFFKYGIQTHHVDFQGVFWITFFKDFSNKENTKKNKFELSNKENGLSYLPVFIHNLNAKIYINCEVIEMPYIEIYLKTKENDLIGDSVKIFVDPIHRVITFHKKYECENIKS
jgi:hypothetical protein